MEAQNAQSELGNQAPVESSNDFWCIDHTSLDQNLFEGFASNNHSSVPVAVADTCSNSTVQHDLVTEELNMDTLQSSKPH